MKHREDSDTLVAGTLSANQGGLNRPAGNANETDFCIPQVVGALSDGAHQGGGLMDRTPTQDGLSRTLNAGGMGRQDWETETLVVTK